MLKYNISITQNMILGYNDYIQPILNFTSSIMRAWSFSKQEVKKYAFEKKQWTGIIRIQMLRIYLI